MTGINNTLMMFVYHLRHAARSLARTPVFTFVMELSLGLGLALWTVARTAVDTQDNVTVANHERIYHIEIGRDVAVAHPNVTREPKMFWDQVGDFMLTYRDTMNLAAASGRPHTISFFSPLLVMKDGEEPLNTRVRFTTGTLFSMFDREFASGTSWSPAEEAEGAQVCVLTQNVAERWFKGENAIGQTVRIAGQAFRVVGVVIDRRTERKLYDFSAFPDADGVYVPLPVMKTMAARPITYYAWGDSTVDFEDFIDGEVGYLQAFVDLPNETELAAYTKVLDTYVAAQRETGRTPKLARPSIRPLVKWAGMLTATPFVLFQLFGGIAFVACIFNLVRLLIAKFSARAGEVAIRRALGAPRITIFMQHLLEAELVSCGGTVLGLLLASAGIAVLNAVIPDKPVDLSLDMRRAMLAAASAVIAGLVAGLYPAGRICNVQPATVLRRQ